MRHLYTPHHRWRAHAIPAIVLIVAVSRAPRDGTWMSGARAVMAAQGAPPVARTVWSGVYTEEQAARGKAIYDASCGSCHGPELAGADGPALAGNDFLRNWLEDNLNSLFVKVHRRMPADAPGSLSERETVDVVSYLLRANEFPAGSHELAPDERMLSAIRVENKGGPGPVPNFSLVRVVGCLSQRPDSAWVLTRGTDPVRTRESGPDPAAAPGGAAAGGAALGSQTFQLMDVASSRPENYKGQIVGVKGLLIRLPEGMRLNVTSLQGSGSTCPS
jgi:mono/diheme cytochrome c family protein